MIFQEHGIYYGGSVTKQTGVSADNLFIEPFFLNLITEGVTGSGDVGSNITKKIKLQFGVDADPQVYRDILIPPRYTIYVGQIGKTIYIYYDEINMDIGLTDVPPINKIVFCAVKWPNNNGSLVTDPLSAYFNLPVSISVVDIDTTLRTEANTAKATTADLGANLYYEEQRYVSGVLNKPLAHIAVAVDVLTAESSLRGGGNYFITLASPTSVHTDTLLTLGPVNMSVILEPCEHIARQNNVFQLYKSKANPTHALVKTYTNPVDFQNKYIYVAIHKVTGQAIITEDTSIVFSNSSTYYPIARTTTPVGASATNLNAVQFIILNNITSLTRTQEDAALIPAAKNPCGAIQPVEIVETLLSNTIALAKPVTFSVLGFGVPLPAQNIELPPAPGGTVGNIIDFVYAEIEFIADPVLHPTIAIKTFRGSSADLPEFILSSGITNNALVPSNYIKDGTYYKASKIENSYIPYTYAIPLAVVPRFNSSTFSPTNPNGAINRPDGKTAALISLDEILNVTPVVNSVSTTEIFGETLQGFLTGSITTAVEQAIWGSGSTGHFSKYPLQVDYLGTGVLGTAIGTPNGGRRLWSHNLMKTEDMSFAFVSNVDSSGYVGVFNYAAGSKLTIKVPAATTDTQITVDPITGQPLVSVVWANDGMPVKLIDNWAVGPLQEVADIYIDTADSTYTARAPGRILVMFKVQYTERLGFSKLPRKVYSAMRNNSSAYIDKYWPTAVESKLGRKVGIVSGGSATINSQNYDLEIWEEAFGSNYKYYSVFFKVARQGNNLTNTAYLLDDRQIEGSVTHRFNGILWAKNQYGAFLEITSCKWDSIAQRFEVKLAQAVPTTEVVFFAVGVEGKELDYTVGSAEITNLTEAVLVNPVYAPASGVLYYSNPAGEIIYGFESLNNAHKIYVEDYACPVAVTGFQTNLIRINLNITSSQFSSLPVAAQANYIANGSGGYRPTTNATLKFGLLQSKNETQSITVNYGYQASSFTRFNANIPAKLVHRGFLIQTNDGSANTGNSVLSPLDLLLPAVQNILFTGDGVQNPSPVGITDVLSYQQVLRPFLEGSLVKLDGSLALEVTVQAGAGLAAWCALIRQEEKLLLFLYEVRDGKFIVNNNNNAWVAELKDFRRER
jgi:hypothetical protein